MAHPCNKNESIIIYMVCKLLGLSGSYIWFDCLIDLPRIFSPSEYV